MRFSTVFATSALVSAAAASTLTVRQDALPTCAMPCIANAPTGDCGNNPGCLCKDQDFIASTTICIQKACTGQDLETAEKLSREQCEAVGVTLTQTSFSQTETQSSASSSASESASSQASSSSTAAGTTTGTGTSSTAQTSQTSPSSAGTAPASTSTGAASSSRTISTFALVGAVALGALAL